MKRLTVFGVLCTAFCLTSAMLVVVPTPVSASWCECYTECCTPSEIDLCWTGTNNAYNSAIGSCNSQYNSATFACNNDKSSCDFDAWNARTTCEANCEGNSQCLGECYATFEYALNNCEEAYNNCMGSANSALNSCYNQADANWYFNAECCWWMESNGCGM